MAVYALVIGKNGPKMKSVASPDTEEKQLPQESIFHARPVSGEKVIQTGIGFFVMSISFLSGSPDHGQNGTHGNI